MKRLLTILLAAGLVSACCLVSCPGSSPGPCPEARAVDFRARGRFLYGFGVGDGSFLAASREGAGAEKKRADAGDRFTAAQRTRLQINAAVSENLSGTVYFEIGTSPWGRAGLGGALGADETNVKVKNAYTDWAVPDTGIRVRMGIQPFVLPNAAGGSAVLDDDAAGITVSWQAAEHAGLTLSWVRPYNDSHTAGSGGDADSALDSLDLFSLALPVSVEGLRVTPWVMWGLMGRNALRSGAGSKRPYPLTFQDTLRWNHPLRAGADGTLSRDGSFDRG
ncbi:MAG: hypothetical protein Q4F72_09440, partial [Desulfovibrionaceae bacterium]|nr:hypothetical protein [Desulfovibrionaceae bacterium]